MRRIPAALSAMLLIAATAGAQVPAGVTCPSQTGGDPNRPFPVCEVTATVHRGPYLSAPTDTSALIVFMTDMPAHVSVLYGSDGRLDREAVQAKDGMLAVGTLHTVRLGGLRPGTRYQYRLRVTPVLELLSYWPKKGKPTESAAFSFTTLDRRAASTTFAVVSDLHESVSRIDSVAKRVDWTATEFLVNTGDSFNGVTSEKQLWDRWLTPLIAAGMQTVPLVFARGNHDTRGGFARELTRHVPIEEGRFYFTRDPGPVHLIVIDTGEDKADSTQVYARLNVMEEYRREELDWFRRHVQESARLRSAPFRVVVMHQPEWGWLAGDQVRAQREWTAVANEAKVDLVIAGHDHRYSLTPPGGPMGNRYPVLVVGQGQVVRVTATASDLVATVIDKDGTTVNTLRLERKR